MATVAELIGNTPMAEIKKVIQNPGIQVFGKLEGNNPGGSVKDRPAYGMIKGILDRGKYKKGMRIIEATSGNTGIALAMIAGLFEVDIELVMPENATEERIKTMRAYGATVTLTSAEGSMEEARDYATQKAAEKGYIQLNQFANPDNYMMHYHTTGPEIWNATNGKITHFISSMGTTGTIMGVSKYLKEQNNDVQIIGVQPKEGSRIPGIRRWPQAYLPEIFEPERVDQYIDISEEEATKMTRELARKEGIFAGMSSGGCVMAMKKIASQLESGVLAGIICDRGDRYLSSDLFI